MVDAAGTSLSAMRQPVYAATTQPPGVVCPPGEDEPPSSEETPSDVDMPPES